MHYQIAIVKLSSTRAFKTEESKEKLLSFSLPNGPRRILVYYQPRDDPLAPIDEKNEDETYDADDVNTYIPGLKILMLLSFLYQLQYPHHNNKYLALITIKVKIIWSCLIFDKFQKNVYEQ